jgi:hypothetical protein
MLYCKQPTIIVLFIFINIIYTFNSQVEILKKYERVHESKGNYTRDV